MIENSGCSVAPAEIFIASKMTNVGEAATRGEGKILAKLGELRAPIRPAVEAKEVLVCSAEAMEKNIDTVVVRRFKKQRMSWITKGANHLPKSRTPWYNKRDWEALWSSAQVGA